MQPLNWAVLDSRSLLLTVFGDLERYFDVSSSHSNTGKSMTAIYYEECAAAQHYPTHVRGANPQSLWKTS
jgi:hypothetical protein